MIPFSTTLDAVGPIARSVVDLAIMLDATVGADRADPATVRVGASYLDAVDRDGLSGRRIGLVTFSGDSEVERLIGSAIEEMRAGGVEVVEVTLPSGADIVPSSESCAMHSMPISLPSPALRCGRSARSWI